MKYSLAYSTPLPIAMLLLSSCGGNSDAQAEPAPTVTVTETVTAEPEEAADDEDHDEEAEEVAEEVVEEESDFEDHGEVGDTVSNYGVDMTLHDAYGSETIPWNESGQPPGNPLYEITQRSADDGAKWFVMETTVDNVGSTSMDLTCSWPIDVVAVDIEEREFDTISSLHQYEENPRCNDNLQPGFSAEMTYVFSVPEDAEMIGVAFRDTEESGWSEYSAFIFDPPLD